jgi:phospholipid-binding lipoprotein MlaA
VARWLVVAALGTLLTGCGTAVRSVHTEVASAPMSAAETAVADVPAEAAAPAPFEPEREPPALAAPTLSEPERESTALAAPTATEADRESAVESTLAAAGAAALTPDEPAPAIEVDLAGGWMAQASDLDAEEDTAAYDPWEPFNERMLEVNRRLDRWVLKPVAKAYNFITPDQVQIMISNGFDNIAFPPRFVNSVLQGKFGGAAREIGRFLINSTVGVGGLFDPAKDVFGLVKSREDFGQTLGFYGVGPGPFLIVPLMEPMTVRDGVGKAVDAAMDPLAYYLPFVWDRLGMKIGDTINERSLNLELFQGFEESVIDLYSAIRHGYLQRREKLIRE